VTLPIFRPVGLATLEPSVLKLEFRSLCRRLIATAILRIRVVARGCDPRWTDSAANQYY